MKKWEGSRVNRNIWGRRLRGGRWDRRRMKREDMFIEKNMADNVNVFGLWVKAPVAVVMWTITEKDTWCGSEVRFMTVVGTKLRKALTTEKTKKIVTGFTVE
jgi:hypothetical protein